MFKRIYSKTRTKKHSFKNRTRAGAREQKVKRIRAQGGCLGTKSRRKT